MPRVRLAVPAEQREIEADLTEHCTGGALRRHDADRAVSRNREPEDRCGVSGRAAVLPARHKEEVARGRSGGADLGSDEIGGDNPSGGDAATSLCTREA